MKENEGSPTKKKTNWFKISIIFNLSLVIIAVLVIFGGTLLHQSNTNPSFCASCHVMQANVDSYLEGHTLDSVHAQANIECKDCHDYSIPAEISSGFKYITGNYEVITTSDGGTKLAKRSYDDEMCLTCHISEDYLANQTDYLEKNPHKSHWPELTCSSCHVSHGEQIDYCSSCHDNGGQRLTGKEIIPRAENPYQNTNTNEESEDS